MKKTYQKPKTTIIVMQLQQMIALSKGEGYATSNGEVLSRRHFIWDDFEDEYDFDYDFE